MKPLKIKQIGKFPIFHIHVPNDPWRLAMTFIRMQEHYESPNAKFRKAPFTLEEYMDWYVKTYPAKGAFTYPKVWTGFNVPGHIVRAVADRFKPLTRWEDELFVQLIDEFGEWRSFAYDNNFYLVGTSDLKDLAHEVSHGMFYCVPTYRREAQRAVRRHLPRVQPLVKYLLTMGYSQPTLIDELHAYALTGWPSGCGKATDAMRNLRADLRAVEQKHLRK